MSVYRPTYTDPKTGSKKESAVWWYHFTFAGRHYQESSKSARKTVAVQAEKNRRREFEQTFNGIEDTRVDRMRRVAEVAADYLKEYAVRHEKSHTFAEYALGHVARLMGGMMTAEVTDKAVKDYQTARLKEKAAAKTINEETGFLLRVLEEQGDAIRAKMRRLKTLKLAIGKSIARAFTEAEKLALLAEARKRRSPAIVPALTLALHCGLRDAELRGLTWGQVDLVRAMVTVGDSKTAAGEGRTIPLNGDVLAELKAHALWYLNKFGETRPEWFLFPYGKPQPTDPTRGATTFSTVWRKVKADAGIKGRWHDARHTFITDLAESPEATDQTIMDMAGHVSQKMLKHYSHTRMEAKRKAVEALVRKPKEATASIEPAKESAKVGALQ
jgi:integrase